MWCVLQVKSGEEMKIKSRLNDMGFPAEVPRENRLQRQGGGWTTKEYTLFPSYVFVELIYTAENYYKIKEIPSVIRFLGSGLSPDTLTFLEIEWLKILSADGSVIEPTKVRITEDGKAEVLDGVLASFKNKIQKIDKHKRKATFEITICNHPKEIELSIIPEDEI